MVMTQKSLKQSSQSEILVDIEMVYHTLSPSTLVGCADESVRQHYYLISKDKKKIELCGILYYISNELYIYSGSIIKTVKNKSKIIGKFRVEVKIVE